MGVSNLINCLSIIYLACSTFISSQPVQPMTLEARFSSGGVKATLTFTQTAPGRTVHVNDTQLTFNWRLHTFPVQFGAANPCDASRLGPRITGQLDLFGLSTIEGRSIALLSGGNIISCATVERPKSVVYATAQATFRSGILGKAVFRQAARVTEYRGYSIQHPLTRLTLDLYSDGSDLSSGQFDWRITSSTKCSDSDAGETFKSGHESQGANCNETSRAGCASGDLKSKLGYVKVSATKGGQRATFVDRNLPLSVDFGTPIIGKTLRLYNRHTKEQVACAVISRFIPRKAVATFDDKGVRGTISFVQQSPWDVTETRVQLQGLALKAGGYHVHNWPVPQRLSADQSLCGPASTSGHFNPFGVVYDESSPGAGEGTEDQYEIGDLSRKYGVLTGLNDTSQTHSDNNLPLFGRLSILGRSIVIHETSGARWVCATIQQQTQHPLLALATFRTPVIGYVLFRQVDFFETQVFVQLDHANGVSAVTSGHRLTVHAKSVSGDKLTANLSTGCDFTGGVYNPLGVSAKDYSAQCQSSCPLRCQMGDFGGKHGSLSVRADGAPARNFFTDVNLPLTGPNSIIGRSVALSKADGSGVLALANIALLRPRRAEVSDWGGRNVGSITFQQTTGILREATTITIDFTNSDESISIREKPVHGNSSSRCSNTGPIYNPFGAASSTDYTTSDARAVGDLAGKFGLIGRGRQMKMDSNLDLVGPQSVVGRALNARSPYGDTSCGDIRDLPVLDGTQLTAVANFDQGDITGTIKMSQYVFSDGTCSDTTVVINLQSTAFPGASGLGWHVHVNKVGDDAHAASGRCLSPGGHFNPYNVNVKELYSECSPSNQLRCELGDSSGKMGKIDLGNQPYLATDINLPLLGEFGVLGRSIVIHAPNGSRVACTNIEPSSPLAFHDLTVPKPDFLDRADIARSFAKVIRTPITKAAVVVHGPEFDCGSKTCIKLRIYVLGFLNKNTAFCTLGARKLFQFNARTSAVSHPCNQKMAQITCGGYDINVTVRNAPFKRKLYAPYYVKVEVTSRKNSSKSTAVEVTVDDMQSFLLNGTAHIGQDSPWKVLKGGDTAKRLVWWDVVQRNAVVRDRLGNFLVEFSLRDPQRKVTVGCKSLSESASYPSSLCHTDGSNADVIRQQRDSLKLNRKRQVILYNMLDDQSVAQTSQCHNFQDTFRSCQKKAKTVNLCEPILDTTLEPDVRHFYFELCLQVFCKPTTRNCQLFKTNLQSVDFRNVLGRQQTRKLLYSLKKQC